MDFCRPDRGGLAGRDFGDRPGRRQSRRAEAAGIPRSVGRLAVLHASDDPGAGRSSLEGGTPLGRLLPTALCFGLLSGSRGAREGLVKGFTSFHSAGCERIVRMRSTEIKSIV
jgi:hypothetical protein